MSQLILFAAIYPLYEISILLVRWIERKREAELRAQGLWDEDADAGRRRRDVSEPTRRARAHRRRARAPRPAARRRRPTSPPPRPSSGRPPPTGSSRCPASPGSSSALLVGIDRARDTLLANTLQFARGYPANNVLLWGARGMGKSSLVKAAHAEAARAAPGLKLIELHREDLPSHRPAARRCCAARRFRFLLFCDDLSFDKDDGHYKSLKAVLDGGIEGRPDNVVLYATSNRRHLMPREMIENERQTGVNPSEATEEKVSLSDRFGLWLGFHACTQDDFLAMIRGYCDAYGHRHLRRRRSAPRPSNGPRPAAPAPAASPGSTSPTSPGRRGVRLG